MTTMAQIYRNEVERCKSEFVVWNDNMDRIVSEKSLKTAIDIADNIVKMGERCCIVTQADKQAYVNFRGSRTIQPTFKKIYGLS